MIVKGEANFHEQYYLTNAIIEQAPHQTVEKFKKRRGAFSSKDGSLESSNAMDTSSKFHDVFILYLYRCC